MSDRRPARHFSMIRSFHLADVFTLMNAFLGAGAVLAFMRFVVDQRMTFFWLGLALLPVALIMDSLDGRIARSRGVASPLGQELDSLADIVSFGVAPAAMAFAAGLRGGWDALFLIYFVGCGISRLARYNVSASAAAAASAKVTYFEGFPIPSSLLLVGGTAVLAMLGRLHDHLPLGTVSVLGMTLHPIAIVFGVHGSLMVSKTVRIPKP
jgi:CDP-diacylglycerol--serine O-phosphatidyltransferase